jgi:hypothetical protein
MPSCCPKPPTSQVPRRGLAARPAGDGQPGHRLAGERAPGRAPRRAAPRAHRAGRAGAGGDGGAADSPRQAHPLPSPSTSTEPHCPCCRWTAAACACCCATCWTTACATVRAGRCRPRCTLRTPWRTAACASPCATTAPACPTDQLARLAQPFYRPDVRPRPQRTGGVGLGMYPVPAGGAGAWRHLCAAQRCARTGGHRDAARSVTRRRPPARPRQDAFLL